MRIYFHFYGDVFQVKNPALNWHLIQKDLFVGHRLSHKSYFVLYHLIWQEAAVLPFLHKKLILFVFNVLASYRP